jgi:GNAT superfamily N-acetyltransferase
MIETHDALLREALRADIPALERVRYAVTENTLRRGLISAEDIRREIEDTGRGWVIESRADGVVAFAIGNAQSRNVWALFCAPGFQCRGHGGRLHAAMTDWLWTKGLERLWLTTGRTTRARAFYERRGWTLVGDAPHDQVRYELHSPADGSPANAVGGG